MGTFCIKTTFPTQLHLCDISSFVDPQGTDYCLVTSVNRHYLSLCSAQGYRFGVSPAGIGTQLTEPSDAVRGWDRKESKFGKCFSGVILEAGCNEEARDKFSDQN